jgi:hypothetical protein
MFLIETSHAPSPQVCGRSLKAAVDQGSHYITNSYWGCDDDVHKSWIFVEASDRGDATVMIPPMDRLESTIVEVRKYTPEQIREMHLP